MKINHFGHTLYTSNDSRAKWELKHYWLDGTIECRYFATQREAQNFALHEGYHKEHYIIARNK